MKQILSKCRKNKSGGKSCWPIKVAISAQKFATSPVSRTKGSEATWKPKMARAQQRLDQDMLNSKESNTNSSYTF